MENQNTNQLNSGLAVNQSGIAMPKTQAQGQAMPQTAVQPPSVSENTAYVATSSMPNPKTGTVSGEIIINRPPENPSDYIIINQPGQPAYILHYRADISFASQKPSEKVYTLIRKHWIVNVGWILRHFLLFLAPIVFTIIILSLKINTSFISLKAFLLLVVAYNSLIFTNVLRLFAEWYFNLFFITDERIIEYRFQTLGRYVIGEMNLENIDDVKQSSSGLLGQLLNYGDIAIYGENENTKVYFNQIPNPTLVRCIVTDLYKKAEQKYGYR